MLFFDGTTTVAEVFSVIVRIMRNGIFTQRMLAMPYLLDPMNAKNLQNLICNMIESFGISRKSVVGFAHDRGSPNILARQTLVHMLENAMVELLVV